MEENKAISLGNGYAFKYLKDFTQIFFSNEDVVDQNQPFDHDCDQEYMSLLEIRFLLKKYIIYAIL